MKRITGIFWKAHPLRAIAETLVIEAILLLALMRSVSDPNLVELLFSMVGICCTVVFSLRVRFSERRLPAIILREIGLTVLLGVSMQAAIVIVAGSQNGTLASVLGAPVNFFAILRLTFSLLFLPLRLLMLSIWQWESARKRRLRWAMLHAYLLTTIILTLLFFVIDNLRSLDSAVFDNVSNRFDPLTNTMLNALSMAMLLVFDVIVAIPFVIVIVAPIAALIIQFIIRPTARRLESLTELTARLRAGDYAARTPVEGEDEIAQLQTDFNAMAAELEQTLSALKTERDTVRGLLDAQRQLAASVSHELRTPVATIRGYLETAIANEEVSPPLHHDLAIMERELTRLQTLLDDLFALSRAQVGRLTLRCVPLDASALIRRVVETSAPLAWQQQKVEIAAKLPPALPSALADAERLEQILYNLIRNSLRHTPPGGIVAIIGCLDTSGKGLQIEVRDTGEGILPDDLPHIWERFYQGARESHGGAGLGLALVKDLTEAMGGSVSVESAVGQGTCVTLRLPLAVLA